MEIYEYSVERPDGTTQPLSAYEGKVLLIVNTATGCGFTPQYRDLEEFYRIAPSFMMDEGCMNHLLETRSYDTLMDIIDWAERDELQNR